MTPLAPIATLHSSQALLVNGGLPHLRGASIVRDCRANRRNWPDHLRAAHRRTLLAMGHIPEIPFDPTILRRCRTPAVRPAPANGLAVRSHLPTTHICSPLLTPHPAPRVAFLLRAIHLQGRALALNRNSKPRVSPFRRAVVPLLALVLAKQRGYRN